MPHIARKKLEEKMFSRIYGQLTGAIFASRNKKKGGDFLSELLTPTEQIMLAKRFTAIVMLAEGFSVYQVHRTLNLSPSSVTRFEKNMMEGHYDTLIDSIMKKKERRLMMKIVIIELLKAFVVPYTRPYASRDRWKWLDEEIGT